MIPVAKELELEKYGGYMLSYNGGRVTNCKTGEIIFQKTLPMEIVPELFAEAERLGIGIMTYQSWGIVAGSKHDEYMVLEAGINGLEINHFDDPIAKIEEPVNKCLGTAKVEIAPDIEKTFREKFGDRITVGRSEPFFIELLPNGVDKAESLGKLCESLSMTKEDLIAVGDGFNDRSMIDYAGIGVAMANAQEPVKEVADYITLSNDEDGVAHVIRKFILK